MRRYRELVCGYLVTDEMIEEIAHHFLPKHYLEREPFARFAMINGERSSSQRSPRGPSHPSLKRDSSMESMTDADMARLASMQRVSLSSPSTTPSPSTPSLSPSCSPRQISYVPQGASTGVPGLLQPEPLNTGGHWSGIRYGTAPEVKFLAENYPSYFVRT